jgi:hypothetical protein
MSAAVKREIKNQCYLASEPKVLKAFADTRTVGTALAKLSFLDNWHSPYIANTRFTGTSSAYNIRLWNLDPQVGNANPDNEALKDFMKRGTDFDERVGRRVTIESVDETLVLQISNNGVDPNTFPDVINVRVIHGWLKFGVDDAGTTGYLASVNEIYEDIDDVRVKVLSDKLYTRRALLGRAIPEQIGTAATDVIFQKSTYKDISLNLSWGSPKMRKALKFSEYYIENTGGLQAPEAYEGWCPFVKVIHPSHATFDLLPAIHTARS